MTYKLIKASAHDTGLPSESIDCVVTSPPYFNLRLYQGGQKIDWPETRYSPMLGMPEITIPAMHCALGNEDSIEAFIGHLILVAREMWRVLKKTGTFFCNLGDSFAGSGGAHTLDHANPGISKSATRDGTKYKSDGGRGMDKTKLGVPAKNMLLIPERFVMAAQADGWLVRSNLPWIKRNGLPSSQTDRPTNMIEHIFMLTKSGENFFDMEAVKMPVAESSKERLSQDIANQVGSARANGGAKTNGNIKAQGDIEGGRSFRNTDFFFKTWQGLVTNEEGDPLALVVNPKGFSGSHFATFPLDLPLTLIRAATSAHGCCAKCQAPWERIVNRESIKRNELPKDHPSYRPNFYTNGKAGDPQGGGPAQAFSKTITVGWQPTCACGCDDVVPATVLDPFAGSGTTLKAAVQLKRIGIGVDICGEYLESLAVERVDDDDRAAAGLPKKLKGKDNDLMNMPLFAEVA